ncbi:MAG TPA: biotin/lipoyl-containing protein, partial [Aquella sp.]|nr:biotin/lipoyl-containing protein [Aquella sp.]
MKVLKEISVPKENVNDEFVIINSVLFNNGDKVTKGDIIATVETSKTDFTIETDCEGFIQYCSAQGEELHVGNPLAIIFDEYNEDELNKFITFSEVEKEGNKGSDISLVANVETEFSKPALDLIIAKKIPKEVFKNKTFVSKADVLLYVEQRKKETNKEVAVLSNEISDHLVHIKLSASKKREISNLSNGQNNGLTCTFSINVNNEGILDHARKNHEIFKLTIIPSLLFEVSRLLEKFPLLNAYYEKEQII